MSILIGPFNPLNLTLHTLNTLLKKDVITYEEAREILKNSLDSELKEDEKNRIVDSMLKRV